MVFDKAVPKTKEELDKAAQDFIVFGEINHVPPNPTLLGILK
jgi:hypothetical protein